METLRKIKSRLRENPAMFFSWTMIALVLAAVMWLAFAPYAAHSTTIVTTGANQHTVLSYGVEDVTTNYTNSTTTASDVTGLSITVPATNYAIGGQFYKACFDLDANKATATTGTVTLSVNGSDVTASARTIATAGGRGTLSSCFVGARPTASAFVVKLRGVSGDTNVFTIYAGGQLSVETFYFPQ